MCLAIATLSLWGCATEQALPPALDYPADMIMEAQQGQVPAGNSSVAFRGGDGEFSCCLRARYDFKNEAEMEKARKEGKKLLTSCTDPE